VSTTTQRHCPSLSRSEDAPCEETQTLLKEIAALSDDHARVRFAESTKEAARLGVDKVPGSVIRGALNRPLRFFGFPVGNELVPLVEGIIEASRGKVELGTETARHLRRLQQTVHVQLFVTPACPHCPPMAGLVMKLGLESSRVSADVIEISEFQRLAEAHHSRRSYLIIDEREVLVGAIDEATLSRSCSCRKARVARGTSGAVDTAGAAPARARDAHRKRTLATMTIAETSVGG
jgi:hypothetical protein